MDKYQPYKPKDGKVNFKAAITGMNMKEKAKYFWEYYKWWVMIPVVVLAFVIHTLTTTNQREHLHIMVTSGFSYVANQMAIEEELAPPEDTLTDHFRMFVDTEGLSAYLGDLLLTEAQQNRYAVVVQDMPLSFDTIPVFTTFTGASVVDIMIAYEHDFHAMAAIGHYLDLRELNVDFSDEMFVNDYGILLHTLPLFDDYIQPINPDIPLILGIAAGTDRIQEVEHFFHLLFND
ncbi:MAG: hypothetical protein FWE07_00255 [Turicibacter sp.]|nr:hypothetical protein [Turicibacter sp.]